MHGLPDLQNIQLPSCISFYSIFSGRCQDLYFLADLSHLPSPSGPPPLAGGKGNFEFTSPGPVRGWVRSPFRSPAWSFVPAPAPAPARAGRRFQGLAVES